MSHAPETSLARRYSFKLLANILNIPIYLLMEAIAQHLYAHYPEFSAVRENIRG